MNKFHIINDELFQRDLKQLIDKYVKKHTDKEPNKDPVWVDQTTNLMWQVDNPEETMNWEEAIEYCKNLTYAGYNDWRLPSIKELTSIIDYSKHLPACKIEEIKSSSYWSASIYASSSDYAWRVDFYDGNVSGYSKSDSYFVRAVRGG